MIYVGIDPGVNGAIAMINDRGKVCLYPLRDMTLQSMVFLFESIFVIGQGGPPMIVMLERLHALPSSFRGCSTSWTLSGSYHSIKTLLAVYEVKVDEVLPAKWQSEIGVTIKKSKVKVDKKKINREKAQFLFPKVEGINLDTADALLIAEYCRRIHK